MSDDDQREALHARGGFSPLRCACCGETDSSEGFLRAEKGGVLDGRRLNDGDTLRVECARRLGFEIPAPTHPPLTFRAT